MTLLSLVFLACAAAAAPGSASLEASAEVDAGPAMRTPLGGTRSLGLDSGAPESFEAISTPDAGSDPPKPTLQPPVDAEPEAGTRFIAGGGGELGIGLAPGATLGLRAELGVRFDTVSLSVEAHADLAVPAHLAPASRSAIGGVFFALLAACLHPGDVSLCAVVGGGMMRSQVSGISQPFLVSTPLALAGGRLAYDIPLGARVRLRAFLDVYARLVQVRLTVDGAPAWTSGPLAGGAGLLLLTQF